MEPEAPTLHHLAGHHQVQAGHRAAVAVASLEEEAVLAEEEAVGPGKLKKPGIVPGFYVSHNLFIARGQHHFYFPFGSNLHHINKILNGKAVGKPDNNGRFINSLTCLNERFFKLI